MEQSLASGRFSVFLKHHLRRLNHDSHSVAFLETKLLRALSRNHTFDRNLSDTNDDMRHDIAELNRRHFSGELISS